MNAIKAISAVLAGLMISGAAMAGDARTSAEASNGLLRRGDATATAHYQGKAGFAQTASHSGAVNAARGVAVGGRVGPGATSSRAEGTMGSRERRWANASGAF